MITLTNSIPIVNNVNQATKWRVTGFDDNDQAIPPFAFLTIEVQGAGGKVYPPSSNFRCTVFDSGPSTCIAVNPSPVRMDDQIILVQRAVSGAYTALCVAFYGRAKTPGRTALEGAALSTGVVPAEFAGV
jgi:hypothetical protein